jgi:ribonuclease HII
VVAAAAVIDPDRLTEGVDDSKKLTPRQRRECFRGLVESLDDWSIGIASAREIDRINILQATRVAMLRAVRGLRMSPDYLLIDGRMELDVRIPQTALVQGDGRCLSIAAASILAKVSRDTLVRGYARSVRGYGLGRNKGYGTSEHRRALALRGPSAFHRRSFRVQGKLPFTQADV